jgi:2-polyprenyl-3-methyl-5-hydroxy-6-metoxy-1,4-benzoquinol methylase
MTAAIPARSSLVLGAPPRSRLGRQLSRWIQQVRRGLGLLGSVHAGDVSYREFTPEPLGRALSRKGRGYKDFRVVFPDGGKMLIRATPRRVFADLAATPLLDRYQRIEGLLAPGMRVLEMGCSTGFGAVWLAERLGRSGAVVALDDDDQAISFAQRRYRLPNVSFETYRADSLAGETDGAFNAVVAPRGLSGGASDAAVLAELWRVVAPGGWLFMGAGPGPQSSLDAAQIKDTEQAKLLDRAELERVLREICGPDPMPEREHRPAPPRHRGGAGVIQFIGEAVDGNQDILVGKPEA